MVKRSTSKKRATSKKTSTKKKQKVNPALSLNKRTYSSASLTASALKKYELTVQKYHRKVAGNLSVGDKKVSMLPPEKVVHMNEKGKIPTWVRGRSLIDTFGSAYQEAVQCPSQFVTPNWFIVVAANRLTVVSDDMWDGHLRPVYTFFNIRKIPLKSQMKDFKNTKVADLTLTSSTWLGDDTEVQVITGDVSGTVYRLDLQSRVLLDHWKPWGKKKVSIKAIRADPETNITAVLSSKNEIKLYAFKKIGNEGRPKLVGSCMIKPEVLAMEWMNGRLVCMTDNEFLEVDISAQTLQDKRLEFVKQPSEIDFKITYEPNLKQKLVKMSVFDKTTLMVQTTKGSIHELDYSNQQRVHTCVNRELSTKKAFAVHPTKRVVLCAGSKGTAHIINYKKDNNLIQTIARRGNANDVGGSVFWSKTFPDSAVMFFKVRIARYNVEHDRLKDCKATKSIAYYDNGAPYHINYETMDYTNVDHDHRGYQFKFGFEKDGDNGGLLAYHGGDRDVDLRKRKKRLDLAQAKVIQKWKFQQDNLKNGINSCADPGKYDLVPAKRPASKTKSLTKRKKKN